MTLCEGRLQLSQYASRHRAQGGVENGATRSTIANEVKWLLVESFGLVICG
jgi:hypothetical protein